MRWLDGITDSMDMNEFECNLAVGDGQEGLACCSSCGHKESDTTERLNWTECFLRPPRLCIPRCLALGEWSHHCGYLGH